MNTTETTQEYPHMTKVRKLCLSMGGSNWDAIFPNTIWMHGGAERMASCLGFLIGMAASGKIDDAEKLAESLFRSFSFGMKATTVEPNWSERPGMTGPEHTWPHSQKLCVGDDRTTFGFSFCLHGLVDQSSQDPHCFELPGNSYEHGKKYKYGRVFNGGILFHGLEQVYAVSISGGSGWQMHT